MKPVLLAAAAVVAFTGVVTAYVPQVSRRDYFGKIFTTVGSTTGAFVVSSSPAFAFEGSGSSAYAGKSPTTKAALRKNYQDRVAADVKDFNTLGKAIAKGEFGDESDAWFFFFTDKPRKNADEVGRIYAALLDLRGLPTKNPKFFEGGDGLLLANTFVKQGKPPDNSPAYKSFTALSPLFDVLRNAGEKKKDAAATKAAWDKTAAALSQYLADVDMPGDLSDPLYN